MKLTVIGTGYVGLVAGACFAESGNDVVGADIDEAKIVRLSAGECPIYEPGLEELLQRNLREKRLSFTTEIAGAVRLSEVVFIAVGTPPGEGGGADLSQVLAVAETTAKNIPADRKTVVVIKSTVPIGTAGKVRELIARLTRHPFAVVSNPEFLKEGAALDDFRKPDRVVIGSDDPDAAALVEELYAPFVRTGAPVLLMDHVSAEMTKYAANCLLASRISFMNEVANLCQKVGADVEAVRRGIGSDTRIGRSFLFPGLGFGGSCFPKDIEALVHAGREAGAEVQVAAAALEANRRQRTIFIPRIEKHFGGKLKGLRLAVWGLAFKPGTDDVREAPAIYLIEALLARGAKIAAYDPAARRTARAVLGEKVRYTESAYAALEGADALIIATEWSEFRRPDLERMKKLLKTPVVFDGRNLYEPRTMAKRGFAYYSIGRPDVVPG